MTDTTQPTLADALAELRAEYLDLAARVKPLTDRQDAIKALIRDLTPQPDTYDVGDGTVGVSLNRRFNEARALQLIPEDRLGDVTYPDTRVDKDRLRVLMPDVFEAAQDTGVARVSIK